MKMRVDKGFTLIELLVVISIIAMLLSVLMPALSKAKGLAKRAACLSLLKVYGTANHLYASANDGWFVPFSQPHAEPGYSWDERWCENKDFRKYISVSARVRIEDRGWNDAFMFPKELRCPAQKITDIIGYTEEIEATEGWKVVISYGLNVEQWRGNGSLWDDHTWWPRGGYYGHHQAKIKNPSEKMMFIDNNYYQARYERANYTSYWDVYGERLLKANLGQTCYRHSGGANLCYFDGHAGYLKKDEVWDETNSPPPFNVYLRKPNMLWDTSTAGLRR